MLDLTTPSREWARLPACDVAILCAARAGLRDCEEHPEETAFINVQQTIELARRLRDAGAFVVFPSTNLVFDGHDPAPTPATEPSPVTEYGRQKAEAERGLLALGEAAVARLGKVLHPRLPLLVEWAAALRRGEVIRPFADARLSPVPAGFVAEALLAIGQQRARGIHHLSSSGQLTYADLARELAASLGKSASLVQPQPAPAGSPRHVALASGSPAVACLTLPEPIPTVRAVFMLLS